MLALLIGQRLRLGWNRVTRGPRRGRRSLGAAVTVVFLVGFLGLSGLNAGTLVDRLARTDPDVARLTLPTLLLAVMFLSFVTSLGGAFHHLFLAPDLELLLAAPVPSRSFLWLKVFETWRDSIHVLLFEAAALFGFGQALHLPVTYYPLALGLGLMLPLGASALGLSVTLVVARLRFGEPLLGLSRLISVLLFIPVGLLAVPALGLGRGRFTPVLGQRDLQALAASLRDLGPPPVWLPSTWAAHVALTDDSAVPAAGLLVGLMILLVALSGLAYDRLFQTAWERVRFTAARTPARPRRRSLATAGPVIGVLQKDWRTLIRDPRWRTSALVSLVALGLPVIALVTSDPFLRATPALRFWLGLVPVPYLAYIFGTQQGAATLAYEGRNIALLRAAPVSVGRILIAKLLGGLVLVLAVMWLVTLALAMGRGGEPLEIGEALLAATWLATWATLAALAGAALTVDFESDNPQRRVGCLGTIVTSTLSAFFFGSNTALFGWAIARATGNVPRVVLGFAPVLDFGLAALAVISVATIVLAAQLGLHRLAAWELS